MASFALTKEEIPCVPVVLIMNRQGCEWFRDAILDLRARGFEPVAKLPPKTLIQFLGIYGGYNIWAYTVTKTLPDDLIETHKYPFILVPGVEKMLIHSKGENRDLKDQQSFNSKPKKGKRNVRKQR